MDSSLTVKDGVPTGPALSEALLRCREPGTLPHSIGEELLSAPLARFQSTWRVVLALSALPSVLVLVIALATDAASALPIALGCSLSIGALIGGASLVPSLQDVRWGRRLIAEGQIRPARVLGHGQFYGGQAYLEVAPPEELEGQPSGGVIRFRVGGVPADLAPLVGTSVPMLHLPREPRVFAVVIPGQGLVTTR